MTIGAQATSDNPMLDRWASYVLPLRDEYLRQRPADRIQFFRDYGRFKDFVAELPAGQRIPLLIHAFEQYRDIQSWDESAADRFFWSTSFAILIGRILASKLNPTAAEACLILGLASRRIAESYDPLRPIEIAEQTFRNKTYPRDLFDAARAYREALATVQTTEGRKARKLLDRILWHDPRLPSKGCWTNRIQRAIAAMSAEEAAAWQWMLRQSLPGNLASRSGANWLADSRRRLSALGVDRFLQRVDEWFDFRAEELIRTNPQGNHTLCLLVLYCGFTDRARTAPIIARLATARFSERARMKKVVEGLMRMSSPLE
jgi:hypothetical protein